MERFQCSEARVMILHFLVPLKIQSLLNSVSDQTFLSSSYETIWNVLTVHWLSPAPNLTYQSTRVNTGFLISSTQPHCCPTHGFERYLYLTFFFLSHYYKNSMKLLKCWNIRCKSVFPSHGHIFDTRKKLFLISFKLRALCWLLFCVLSIIMNTWAWCIPNERPNALSIILELLIFLYLKLSAQEYLLTFYFAITRSKYLSIMELTTSLI